MREWPGRPFPLCVSSLRALVGWNRGGESPESPVHNQGGSMTKIITTAALALALSAFAARAQTNTDTGNTTTKKQTTEDKGTAVLPGDQNSSALPGNSSNTATSNSTLPSNDPKANTTPAADTSAKKGQTQPDDGSKDDVKPPKSNKKVKKRNS